MKPTSTCLLLLTISWLSALPIAPTHAQTYKTAASARIERPRPASSFQLVSPPGAPALPQLHAQVVTRGPQASKPASWTSTQKRLASTLGVRPAARLGAPAARTQAADTVYTAWVATYPATLNRVDQAFAVAVDAAGNVGVGGQEQTGAGMASQYVLVKYAPSGQVLWEARYPAGQSPLYDRTTAVAVDAAGNFYLSGYSVTGSPVVEAYVTVKYSPSGQQLWAATYQGPVTSADRSIKVVVDRASNVYVKGSSVLKYSATGQQLWRVTGGTDLAVDAAGNVVVTGSATTKYSAGGQQLWSVSGGGTTVDVDATGQVYVSGTVDSGTNSADYVARKYATATGQVLWETRYGSTTNSRDEVVDAAVDAAGNLYVTGTTYSLGATYLTTKVGPAGQVLWQTRARDTGVGSEMPRRLVLDAAGDVYVTGTVLSITTSLTDYLTIKYQGATGQQQWNLRYNTNAGGRDREDRAEDLAVDVQGNVYVTGTTYFTGLMVANFTTVKYVQPHVHPGWTARFTGSGSSAEVAQDVVTDAAGNVYVSGYAYNGRNYDYATLKYSPTGQQLWEARYNGPADGQDVPTNVVVDAAGNVVVSGTSYSATGSDYATLKYSPSGQLLWEGRYNGPASSYDIAAKARTDAAGNVYVTGSSDNGPSGSYDYATVKYSANGQQQWATRYNGPAGSFDIAADLVVDALGNVVVTGTTYSDTQSDYATLQYSSTGQQLWEARYNGPANGYDEAAKVALLGTSGNVVVTGTSEGGSTGYDFATLLYLGSGGQSSWVSRYNDTSNKDDVVADLAVTSQGEVMVAGTSHGGASADYCTVRYAGSSGQPVWQRRYDGPAGSYDQAKALAVDAAGNAYVTGLSYNADGTNDYATVKYAYSSNQNPNTGSFLWEQRYNGPGNSYDEAAAIAVDETGMVYVTGLSFGAGTGYDFATLQYSQALPAGPLTASAPSAANVRTPLGLAGSSGQLQELAVYPNPTTGPATVRFRPVQDGVAQVQLYNQLGQQVATLYAGTVRKGQHYELQLDSQKLPAGLYTCSLLVGSQRETIRLLVQR